MKIIVKLAVVLAALLALAIPEAMAQTYGSIPTTDENGRTFRARLNVGKLLDPSKGTGGNSTTGSSTTLDSVDFGFWTDYVRVCLHPALVDRQAVYIRMATSITTNTASLTTAALASMTAPASSSAAFIGGVPNTRAGHRAISMTAPTSRSAVSDRPHCEIHPWRTRGITIHIVSSHATMDVSGHADGVADTGP